MPEREVPADPQAAARRAPAGRGGLRPLGGPLLLLASTALALALVHGVFRAVTIASAALGAAGLVRRARRRG